MNTFLSTPQFAEVVGISRQAASDILRATFASQTYKWRGARLIVRKRKGVGGKSGECYEVAADSLPETFHPALKDSQRTFERPLRHDQAASWKLKFRLTITTPIMALPPRPRAARVRAIKEAASRTYTGPDGKPFTVSSATIGRWLKKYRAEGLAGLTVKKRNDAGKPKVIVTRKFDKEARVLGVDDERLQNTAKELIRYIRSIMAGSASPHLINTLATAKLNELARGLGIAADGRTFNLPRHIIDDENDAKDIARKRTDAKSHKDSTPSILRTSEGLEPNELWVVDTTKLDILYRRDDGSTATPWLIHRSSCPSATSRRYLPSATPSTRALPAMRPWITSISKSATPTCRPI